MKTAVLALAIGAGILTSAAGSPIAIPEQWQCAASHRNGPGFCSRVAERHYSMYRRRQQWCPAGYVPAGLYCDPKNKTAS